MGVLVARGHRHRSMGGSHRRADSFWRPLRRSPLHHEDRRSRWGLLPWLTSGGRTLTGSSSRHRLPRGHTEGRSSFSIWVFQTNQPQPRGIRTKRYPLRELLLSGHLDQTVRHFFVHGPGTRCSPCRGARPGAVDEHPEPGTALPGRGLRHGECHRECARRLELEPA